MQPPKGYYRKLISDPNIRIAFTHTPMYGVLQVPNHKVLEELKASDDEYAQYYINGLENGSMLTIVEISSYSREKYSPGELYFKS